MRKHKIWMSWSTGKDSAYALYEIQKHPRYEVVGLLTTVTDLFSRVSMHGTRVELLKEQSQQVQIPLYPVSIPYPCSNEIYQNCMRRMIDQALDLGVTHIVFGDLFLEDVRAYREAQLAGTGIEPIFPLWQKDTNHLAREMIAAGIKAVVTCVDPRQLDASFVGRQFDEKFLEDLPPEVDPCGERGEFHTFVYDAPVFGSSIDISIGEIVNKEGFVFADVLKLK